MMKDDNKVIELYNVPVSDEYKKIIDSFDCGNQRVNDFLKEESLIMHKNNLVNTKLFLDKDERLVGFISLFNDTFRRINKQKLTKEKWDLEVADFYPAIRLHFIGVDKKLQNIGVGNTMMFEVFDISVDIARKSGCTFITLESFEETKDFYIEGYGFRNMGKKGEFYHLLFKIDELY